MSKKRNTSISKNDLALGLVLIIAGVLFCIYKASILNWMMTVIGVLLIVVGIIDILNKRTTYGIIEVVVGAVIIICGWTITSIVLIVLGVLLIIWAIMNVKCISKNNLFGTLKVICAAVLGVLLIVNKWAALDWLFVIIGIIAIIDGVLILLGKN